ncbi:glycosyltransferase [Deinococcus sp. HSC-46F16]|uniref:glycosyltransferase n=1 Tax=Deinococcus sp. HSC-46F16 TaxID=2910968 RepID=UPI002111C99C|nr:glycosyltransferase [Deinococcus sp. HSC-46F16]
MATYNGMKYLPAQITSILKQLASDDEVVIQDDGSSDGTVAYLMSLGDPRVLVEVNPGNRGVITTFERALKRARGEIVFLSDQDDVWLPGKVAHVLAEFSRPEVMAVVTDAEIIDASEKVVVPSYHQAYGGRAGVWKNFWRNSYLGCCLAFRREVLQPGLDIPKSVRTHDGWLGLVSNMVGEVVFLDKILLKYRRHGGNASQMHRFGWPDVIKRRLALAGHMIRVYPSVRLTRKQLQRRTLAGGKHL